MVLCKIDKYYNQVKFEVLCQALLDTELEVVLLNAKIALFLRYRGSPQPILGR